MHTLNTFKTYSKFDDSPDELPEASPNDESPNNFYQSTQEMEWSDHVQKRDLMKTYKRFNKAPSTVKFQAFLTWVETKKNNNKLTFYRSLKDFYFSTSQVAIHLYQKSEIFCLALSPDNSKLIVGCNNNSLYVWDLTPTDDFKSASDAAQPLSKGAFSVTKDFSNTKSLSASSMSPGILHPPSDKQPKLIKELKSHENKVTCLVTHGDYIYSGSFDNTIIKWDYDGFIEIIGTHHEPILSLAIVHDGTKLVSGSEDQTIRIWDIMNKMIIKILSGHTSPIDALVISPDSLYIISGSWDLTIRFWNISTGDEMCKLEGHKDLVRALAISSKGTRLYSGSADKLIIIWELVDLAKYKWERKAVLEGHTDVVRALSISPDSTLLASCSSDKTVRIWDVRHDNIVKSAPKILDGHSDRIRSVLISGDGKSVISGCWDKIIRIWTLKETKDKHILKGHTMKINVIKLTENENKAISGGEDGKLIVWDLKKREKIAQIEGHIGGVKALDIHSEGLFFISGGQDKKIIIWNLKTYQQNRVMNGHSDEIVCVKFALDGLQFVSVSLDKTIRIWDCWSETQVNVLTNHPSVITSLEVNSEMNIIITGNKEGNIYIWDYKTLKHITVLSEHTDAITQLKLLYNDYTKMASSSEDSIIIIWDLARKTSLLKMVGHEGAVLSFEMNREARKLVSGGADKTIRIWDLMTGKQIAISVNNKEIITAMDYSTKGGFLIYSAEQNLIKIRRLNKMKTINLLKSHSKAVKCLDLSRDETILVSGSDDNLIKIWDFRTFIEKGPPLRGHSHQVLTVKITDDNMRVISGSADNTIRIWNINEMKIIGILKGTSGKITCMELYAQETRLLSGAYDNSLRIWDLVNLKKIDIKYIHSSAINALAITKDQQKFFSGGKDNQILVGDLTKFKEITYMKGHMKQINALVVTDDGTKLISGSSDKTVKIWNLAQYKLLMTMNTGSEVLAMGLNLTKTKLLLGLDDKIIQMWDLQNYKQISLLEGHMLAVNALIVIPSSTRLLISASNDTNIRIWDLNDSKKINFTEGHSLGINQIVCTNDGKKVISVSKDRRAIVWDIEEGKQINIFQQHTWTISALAITSDGKKAITATLSVEIKVWNIETMDIIKSIHTDSPIECLIISHDDTTIYIGCCDSFIRIINIITGELVKILEKHTGTVKCLTLNRSGSRLISGGADNLIVIWDMNTFESIKIMISHENSVNKLIISRDESRIYSGSEDKTIMIWSFITLKLMAVLKDNDHPEPIRTMVLSSDESRLIVGCCPEEPGVEGKFIYIWDVINLRKVMTLDCVYGCRSLCLTPNNDKLIAAAEKSLYIYDINNNYRLDKILRGYSNKIIYEELTYDNKLILATDDNLITVWDLIKLQKMMILEGHSGCVNACICLYDGRLISASNDKSIRIWNLKSAILKDFKTLTHVSMLQGHSSPVNTLAIAKNEQILISGGSDKSIRIWDLLTMKQKLVLNVHLEQVTVVRVLKNTQIMSGSKDRILKLWNLGSFIEPEEPKVISIINHTIENIIISPDEKLFLIITGASKLQVWTTSQYEWLNESDIIRTNNFHSMPTFLSLNDCRLVLYFNNIYDCYNGEIIFTFQIYHDLLSFYFDRNSCSFYYLSSQFEFNQMDRFWLNNYIYMFFIYDSLPALPKDENIICNRTQSIFPFFFSFMHLIAIFEKKDYFTLDKMEEVYGVGNVSLDHFDRLDIFLNTPLEILILKKNTNLIFKYFDLLFEIFDNPKTSFYQKTRFLNFKFKGDDECVLDMMNEIIDVCEDDYSILNKLMERAFLDIDPKIYANNLIFDEMNEPMVLETDSLYTIDKNFIEQQLSEKLKGKKTEKTSIVKCKVICLPYLNDISNEKTIKIFSHLADGNCINDIFCNDVLYIMTHFIWSTQIKFYYKIEAIIFIIFFLLYNLNFLYFFKERSKFNNFEYYDSISITFDVLIVLYSLYCATNEAWQMISCGFFDYFDSIWNYIDIILIPLMIFSAVLDIYLIGSKALTHISYIKIIFSICMFCFWFRLLSFFRALKEYSSTMRLILNVITGVPYFVMFVALFILMLSATFLVVVNDDNGEDPTLWQTFYDFYLSAVGDYSGLDVYNTDYAVLVQFFVIISTALFSIILFNLLVAILGDKHDEIKNAEDQTRLYELTNIIEDTNTAIITRIMKWIKKPKKRGAYLVYLYNEKHEKPKDNQNDSLERKIEDLHKETNRKIERVEDIANQSLAYNENHEKNKSDKYDSFEKKIEDMLKETNKKIEKVEEIANQNLEKFKEYINEMNKNKFF